MNEAATNIREKLAGRERISIADPTGTPAGVLVPLFAKDGETHVLLTLRSQNLPSHKGHISFPGGACEEGDKDILETALRETYEEVGIKPNEVTVLGKLDDVIAVSNHTVTPIVGVIPYPYDFKVSTEEIDELVEVPLSFFMNPQNCRIEPKMFRGREVRVYYYQYGKFLVWGLTAYILREFLEICYGIPR